MLEAHATSLIIFTPIIDNVKGKLSCGEKGGRVGCLGDGGWWTGEKGKGNFTNLANQYTIIDMDW